ncbi:MAG: hypothetical protein QOJ99_745 [Bryobacterales bacterium]|nr:hypothetical protein [Bryobacterales bacterium]
MRQLAPGDGDPHRAALEAIALEGVRSGKLSVSQAPRLLGVASRYEMDGFLKEHGVLLNVSVEDVQRDTEIALQARK